MVAAFLVGWGAVATTDRADGFIEKVVSPTTGDLTTAAKSILSNPTFIAENVGEARLAAQAAGGARGALSAGGALSVLQAAGAYPVLGGALAFGAGVGIGTAICNVVPIFGTCLFEEVTEQNTETTPKWSWSLPTAGSTPFSNSYNGYTLKLPTGMYVASPTATIIRDTFGCASSVYPFPPNAKGAHLFYNGIDSGGKCNASFPVPEHYTAAKNYFGNKKIGTGKGGFAETNGDFRYSGGLKTTPNPGWSATAADALTDPAKYGLDPEATEDVAQHVAHEIDAAVHNPYKTYVEIPNCDGLVYASCEELLEERGLDVERQTRTWETADVDAEPDEVLELEPAKATEVEVGTTVVVTTNPDEAGMPIVVPSPETGETYDEYAARLNPALTPKRVDLGEAYIDPAKGPNEVVTTSPSPETRLDPTTGHDVTVRTNPETAPVPPGAWMPPGIPALDLTPLEGLGTCSVFPFGLLCWMGEALAQFNTSGECPELEAPIDTEVVETEFEVSLCGETTDTIMGYLRPALLLVYIVGLGFLFARATRAIGGG